jgi:hypothetical protein
MTLAWGYCKRSSSRILFIHSNLLGESLWVCYVSLLGIEIRYFQSLATVLADEPESTENAATPEVRVGNPFRGRIPIAYNIGNNSPTTEF